MQARLIKGKESLDGQQLAVFIYKEAKLFPLLFLLLPDTFSSLDKYST